MLPLCTSVTLLRSFSTAYLIAARIRRFEPVSEIGLMPTPESARMFQPNSSFSIAISALRFRRALFDLEAGVDVLGVLPEDHHVDGFGVLHRRRHALEPAHRAQAHVEVEDLAQRDVQRADAAADRRGQRPLDPDQVLAERRRRSRRAATSRWRRRPSRRRAPPSTRSSCRAWPRRRPSPAARPARCRRRCRRLRRRG